MTNRQPLSYARGDDAPLSLDTIGEALSKTASQFPDGLALVVRDQQVRWTWGRFLAEVDRAARAFLSLGAKKGDRIAIWSTNRAEWVVTQFAAARIGAILVNLNPAYRAIELAHALKKSETQFLVLIRGFRDCDYVDTLRSICPELEAARDGRFTSHVLPDLTTVIYVGDAPPPGLLEWNSFLSQADAASTARLEARGSELACHDPVNIQFTSGTTGSPKGATLTHFNLLNNARFTAATMRIGPTDRICVPVPFYHCFGAVIGNLLCASTGAALVVPAHAFDAGATLAVVEEERCTAIYGVPTMFIAELEHPEFARFDLSSLRTGIMGGAPCPVEVMQRVLTSMHCREITIAYGLTEASPAITQTHVDDPVEIRVGTVGRALPNTEVKLLDPVTGETTAVGTPGELCTRGYLVMKGYYKDDAATRAAIDPDGWLHSGDLAVMDAGGCINITGRLKDLIVRGGENISPREIEEFLYTHPAVSEAQVIGIPDATYGEEPMAWIRLKEGAACTAEEIRAYCRGRIANYKIPKRVKFVDAFPMTVTGKIQKFRMREMAIEELGLQAAAAIRTA